MEVFLQQCYDAVRLPEQLDAYQRYFHLFDDWSTRLMASTSCEVRIYLDKKNIEENSLKRVTADMETGIGMGDNDVSLKVNHEAVPWMILAVHVLLDYSTDVSEITSALVDKFRIHGIFESTVEQVLCWSLHPLNLDYTVNISDRKKTRQDQAKRAITDEASLSEKRTEIWRKIFDHLHRHEALTLSKPKASVVYFALFRLSEDASRGLYTILFIDAATGALAYTSPFQREQEGLEAISRYCRKHIDSFLREHGQPSFMICVNPWDGGESSSALVTVLQDAIKGLPPLATRFCIYTPRDENTFCALPTVAAISLLRIAERLEDGFRSFQESPLFSYYSEKGSEACWEYVFLSFFEDLRHRKFCVHQPRSYFLGRDYLNSKPPRLEYLVPTKEATMSLMGKDCWDKIYISPYLDVEAGGMAVQHEDVTHMDEDAASKLDNILTLSSDSFLHDFSSEERSVKLTKRTLNQLAYLRRVAQTPKAGIESPSVKPAPSENNSNPNAVQTSPKADAETESPHGAATTTPPSAPFSAAKPSRGSKQTAHIDRFLQVTSSMKAKSTGPQKTTQERDAEPGIGHPHQDVKKNQDSKASGNSIGRQSSQPKESPGERSARERIPSFLHTSIVKKPTQSPTPKITTTKRPADDVNAIQGGSNAKKRGRGRPRKILLDESPSQKAAPSQSPSLRLPSEKAPVETKKDSESKNASNVVVSKAAEKPVSTKQGDAKDKAATTANKPGAKPDDKPRVVVKTEEPAADTSIGKSSAAKLSGGKATLDQTSASKTACGDKSPSAKPAAAKASSSSTAKVTTPTASTSSTKLSTTKVSSTKTSNTKTPTVSDSSTKAPSSTIRTVSPKLSAVKTPTKNPSASKSDTTKIKSAEKSALKVAIGKAETPTAKPTSSDGQTPADERSSSDKKKTASVKQSSSVKQPSSVKKESSNGNIFGATPAASVTPSSRLPATEDEKEKPAKKKKRQIEHGDRGVKPKKPRAQEVPDRRQSRVSSVAERISRMFRR